MRWSVAHPDTATVREITVLIRWLTSSFICGILLATLAISWLFIDLMGIVGILVGISVGMVLSAKITVDLCLSWRSRIRHGNIIWAWSSISNRTILWCILRTCISIWSTTSSSSSFIRYIRCYGISIGVVRPWSWLCHLFSLLLNHIFPGFLHSSLKAIGLSLCLSKHLHYIRLWTSSFKIRAVFP